jgi:hypothetical protein
MSISRRDILDKSVAQYRAASEMLAALEHTLEWILNTAPATSFAPREMCRAAIEQAKACGIEPKVKS